MQTTEIQPSPWYMERIAELDSKLGAQQTAVEQARRDLRQALDILEGGGEDADALRAVRLRIYEAGKQLAGVC